MSGDPEAGPSDAEAGPSDAEAGPSDASLLWVQEQLRPHERIGDVVPLHGGWTSDVRRVEISGPDGERSLALRSFVRPELADAAEELLTREAEVLRFLEATEVPTARLVAVDARNHSQTEEPVE